MAKKIKEVIEPINIRASTKKIFKRFKVQLSAKSNGEVVSEDKAMLELLKIAGVKK